MSPAAVTPFPNESVESLVERIRLAVSERQSLRADGCGPDALEQNRLQIVRLQRLLSQALIARYLPTAA